MPVHKMRRQLRARGPDLLQPHARSRTAVLLPVAIAFLFTGLALPASAEPMAADPHAPVPKTRYRPVIEGYTPYRPVEPRAWQGVNRDVAPKAKPPTQEKR